MEVLKPLILKHPFSKDFAPHHLHHLASCATLAHFEPEQYIFHEAEEANAFYLIIEGEVALETQKPDGQPVVIQFLPAGEALGWSWLAPPHHWRFDARAVKPTGLIVLDAGYLRAQCAADHEFGYALLQRLAIIIGQRLEVTRLKLSASYRQPDRFALAEEETEEYHDWISEP